MQTFSLAICQRIAAVLGDKTPNTRLGFDIDSNQDDEAHDWLDCSLVADLHIKAFTLADLTGEVWQEIGKKLGWGIKNCIPSMTGFSNYIDVDLYDFEESERASDWEVHALVCYEAWLTGGYEGAEAYLDTILPKV